VSTEGTTRCPRCGTAAQAGQEYCLECGARLGREPAAATPMPVAERSDWSGAWILPALLGLVIAILGTGAAIVISGDGEEQSAIPTATGGNLTVTGGTPTLTAPEPTTGATTAPATTAPQTTTGSSAPPINPAAITWPRDRRGWTIVLLSLPQSNGRDAAGAQAKKARDGGLRRVGVLDSSRYASLHPGYYVIFHGVFDTEAEASSALQRARTVFPTAYQREIVP
jgi:hypothetical protein